MIVALVLCAGAGLALSLGGAYRARAAEPGVYDEVTRDEVRIAALEIDEIVDGTGPWDADSSAGNDSADNNKVVRSYDTVVYALHYTTEAQTLGNLYKHGWIYCEATLPVSPDKATFNLNAIERDYPPEYTGPREVVYEDGVQKLVWFRERLETKNDKGEVIEPLPNEATFPVTVDVLAANNGDMVQPTFKLSVAYMDEADGTLKTEGPSYDKPKSVTADPVEVSAAPKYNVKLEYDPYSENFNGTVRAWDFSTGNADGEYPALYRDKGTVYGKLITVGVTLQLYNDDPTKGLKGIETPSGPITFDLNLGATFAGNSVDDPLVWSYGPQIQNKSEQQDGRDVNSYVATGADYAVREAPRNSHSTQAWRDANPGASSPVGENATVNCWDGGTWKMSANGNKVSVTVDDYDINMNWFPSGDLGNAASTTVYYNPKNGVTNVGCFSAGQLFLVVPFGGSTDSSDPDFYPTKYGSDGNVTLTLTDDNMRATSIGGQTADNSKQMVTRDDSIETAVVLTRPGTRVNRVFYQALNRYGNYSERGVNDTYAAFQEGSDVATVGQEISTCWGLYLAPNGDSSQSASAHNALLKFDPVALEPTGEFATNGPQDNSLYPQPGSTTFLYGFKPDGSAWASVDEMDETTEKDLVFYDSPTAGPGTCVAILAEARNYPETAQQERLSFSAKFKVKNDFSLVGNTYALTSGSYVWTPGDVTASGGSIPSRAGGAPYADGNAKPTYETYYSSTKISEGGQDVNFRKAWYDESGYHAENGNYITGDTLYIVGYQTKIQKNVEQANGADIPKPVVSYSLSKGQSIVDYVLKPDFVIPDIEGVDFSGMTTTLTVSDVLPAGVTYLPGSAYVGGTWQQNTDFPDRSDVAYLHGSIEGGTATEPEVTLNEDGTTTLTWTFENMPIENIGEDHWIHFSANLPQAISRTTSYVNTAVVSSTEDRRKQEAGNGNLDTATIQVAPASDLVCTKTVDEPFVDADSPIGFNLRWNNTAPAGSFDNVMMDTMPSNGNNGSEFTGTYTVSEPITITPPPGKTAANYTFYYTTDAAASTQQASLYQSDYKDGAFSGNTVRLHDVTWTKATISADNTVPAVEGKPITAFILLGRIDKLEELSAHVVIEPANNDIDDTYVNMLSSNLSTTTTNAKVVSRVISGKVWVDDNLNGGSLETEEPLVEGVRVELLMKNPDTGEYEPVTDAEGNPRFTLTDANGHYEFNRLKAGTYRVNFTNNGTSLKSYLSTIQRAEGIDENHNSKATPVYEDDVFGYIEDIVLPPAREIRSSPYRVPYQDMGLYNSAKKDYDNEADERTWREGDPVKVGSVIPYRIDFTSVNTEVQDITFTDTFSVGLQFGEDAKLEAKDASGQTIELALEQADETVNEDGSVTVTWFLKDVPAKASGTITYTATVTDEAARPIGVKNDATVQFSKNGSYREIGSLANPILSKSYSETTEAGADSAQVHEGDRITYEISWANVSDTAQVVRIVDPIDPGLDVDEDTISENGSYSSDSRELCWEFTAEPGESGVVSFTAVVNAAGAAKGRVDNTASFQLGEGEEFGLNLLSNPVPNKRYASDSRGANGAVVAKGDSIDYEIVFAAVKEDAPTKVEISDTMSAGLEYEKGSAKLSGNSEWDSVAPDSEKITENADGSTTVVWTFEALEADDYVLSYSGVVAQDATVSAVNNSVTFSYDNEEPQPLNELDNPLEPTPDVPVKPAEPVKPSKRKVVLPDTGDAFAGICSMAVSALGAVCAMFVSRNRWNLD